ncbi:MAG TPA: histone [archaeon]|nr:histone [archaeon]
MAELTLQPIRRLFFKAGAKRVADKAAEALISKMEERSLKIAGEAWNLARHAGRSTVMKQDVKMAEKLVKEKSSK